MGEMRRVWGHMLLIILRSKKNTALASCDPLATAMPVSLQCRLCAVSVIWYFALRLRCRKECYKIFPLFPLV